MIVNYCHACKSEVQLPSAARVIKLEGDNPQEMIDKMVDVLVEAAREVREQGYEVDKNNPLKSTESDGRTIVSINAKYPDGRRCPNCGDTLALIDKLKISFN